MTSNFARQPAEFEYGNDFDIFWERFQAFLTASKCEQKSQYSLFLSYLDDISFRRVKALAFGDEHKTESKIDLTKAFVLIKDALTKPAAVPEKISLRYRIQGAGESVSEFGDAIRLLGIKVYGSDDIDENSVVIDSFCVGLADTDLSSKMLQKTFTSLAVAIKYAASKRESSDIGKFLTKNRTAHPNSELHVFPVAELRNTASGLPEHINATQSSLSNSTDNATNPTQPLECTYCHKRYHDVQHCFKKARDRDQICVDCGTAGHRFCNKPSNSNNNDVVCFGCGLKGHVRKFCRKTQNPRWEGVICFNCGVAGHVIRNCRRPRNTQNTRNVGSNRTNHNTNFQRGPGDQRAAH